MRFLVTGAAGFIGSHLCERLIRDGYEVTGLDAFIPYYPRVIKESNISALLQEDRFRFVEADLRCAELAPLLADADVVIHMAAMAGPASWDIFKQYLSCNVAATQRLLEAITSVDEQERRRFIQISTSSVYGAHAVGDESTALEPVSPYGITKLAAEQLAFAYQRKSGLPVVALRYFSIFGPRQRPDMAYHKFINSILRDEPITIFGDGEQTRGNTYIDDCVEGTVLAINGANAGEAYNIGGGVPISLNQAIEIIENAIGKKAQRTYVDPRPGDQRHTLADISKAHKSFGFQPKTNPTDGLTSQVEWQRTLD